MPYFTEVTAPVARAQTSANLLASAVPDQGSDRRWMDGVSWIGELCPELEIVDPCAELDDSGELTGGEFRYAVPLGYRMHARCTTMGGPRSFPVVRDRLARQAEAVGSFAVARELAEGAGAVANPFVGPSGATGLENQFFADTNAETVTGATSILDALGLLEQEARDRTKGMQVFLHIPIRIATQVAAQLQRVGPELRTHTDAVVVADAGYTGAGPLDAGTAEVQTVTITGAPTGGTFTLGGSTPLAFNASAAAVQAALRTAIGNTGITVTGANGGPYTVTFPGTMGNVAQLSSTSSLTGGAAPAVNVATTTPGVAPASTAGIWGYATGPVFVKLGPTAVVDQATVTIDRRTNTQDIWADRMFLAGFDPCCQLAIQFPEP